MGKLLIIADLDDKCAATPRGLELAHKLGHATEVVAFTHATLQELGVSAGERAALKQRLLEQREQQVQARIDKYQQQGQKVALKVVWTEDAMAWVIKRATKGCDMVVKTGQGPQGRSHSSSDWQLFRECPAPVLLVAEKKWHHTKPVLAAIDLGTRSREKRALNDQVLVQAKRMAQALRAELKIICAVEVPALLDELDLVDPIAYVKEQRAGMAPYIAELAAEHQLAKSAFRTKRGPVDKVIASEAAELRAQLVVMGTVGRKGITARLLGNTAEAVLNFLRTDVLALKP